MSPFYNENKRETEINIPNLLVIKTFIIGSYHKILKLSFIDTYTILSIIRLNQIDLDDL